MKSRVVAKAKRDEDPKVSITFQSKQSLKEQFEAECKKEGISMTATLNALMETFLEDQGIEISDQNLVHLIEMQKDIMKDLDFYTDESNSLNDKQQDEKAVLETSLLAIHRELQKRGAQ